MKKTINNPILGKIVILFIPLILCLYLFTVSSFKTILICENGICNLKTTYLFGEMTNKNISLVGGDFYCKEERKLEHSKVEDYESRNVYVLTLQGEKVFKYTYKDSCTRELGDIRASLHQYNAYSNIYEHFFINILHKTLGTILALFSFLILVSKISPVNIEIKTKPRNRK